MDKKIRIKRIIWLVFVLLIATAVIYYVIEVLFARADTPKIVDAYYDSGQIEMTIDDLSEKQKQILLAVEDPGFYEHPGTDFKTPGAGWTTITQGLAKKFYFKDFQQGLMKIKQTLCARFSLDPLVDKDVQLTLYINIMSFGNGITGLNDAAGYYFNKKVSDLSGDEYIALIGSLIDPKGLNIKDSPKENALRVKRIKKVLSGAFKPGGLFDITYEGADKAR